MKFAVAYINYFDYDLRLTVVEAVDCVEGIIAGARILMGSEEYTATWLDKVSAVAATTNNFEEAIELIQGEFFDCDSNITICEI